MELEQRKADCKRLHFLFARRAPSDCQLSAERSKWRAGSQTCLLVKGTERYLCDNFESRVDGLWLRLNVRTGRGCWMTTACRRNSILCGSHPRPCFRVFACGDLVRAWLSVYLVLAWYINFDIPELFLSMHYCEISSEWHTRSSQCSYDSYGSLWSLTALHVADMQRTGSSYFHLCITRPAFISSFILRGIANYRICC